MEPKQDVKLTWAQYVVTATAVAMSCYHLYTCIFGIPESQMHRMLHLMFACVLTFFIYNVSGKKNDGKVKVWDILLTAATVVSLVYMILNLKVFQNRISFVTPLTTAQIAVFVVLLIVVLEATRRLTGPTLPIACIVFILYALFGNHLPGILGHNGFTVQKLLEQVMLTSEGVFGSSLGITATYVVVFIIFASFLEITGAGQFFIHLATGLTGSSRGGPAKVAVLASALMGMINGSAIANVATTGTITIPLMKRTGYRKEFAGAVEAAASTGGQFCPPIMGAVGFVMAEFLHLSYTAVMLAAAVPAFLYYLGLLLAVHFEARRLGLSGLSKENIPDALRVIREQGHLAIPLAVLLILMFLGYTPLYAAAVAIAATVAASWLRRDTRMTWDKIVAAAVEGARSALSVGVCCILIGIIIGTVTLTSLGLNMGYLLLSAVEGGSVYLIGLTVMVISAILGMGVPGVAAYVIVQAVAAPALIRAGVLPISAHMFCLLYACLSNITPPVAMSSYVAAGIAGSNQTKTALLSVRLGLVGFLIPFFFLDHPILLLGADPSATLAGSLWALLTASVGTAALAGGLEGWFLRRCSWPERLILLSVAPLTLLPGTATDWVGLAILATVAVFQFLTRRKGEMP